MDGDDGVDGGADTGPVGGQRGARGPDVLDDVLEVIIFLLKLIDDSAGTRCPRPFLPFTFCFLASLSDSSSLATFLESSSGILRMSAAGRI